MHHGPGLGHAIFDGVGVSEEAADLSKFSAQGEEGKQKGRDNRGGPTTEATCASQVLAEWVFLGIHCGPLFHRLSILQSTGGARAWRGSKLASFPARALRPPLTYES